MARKIYLGIQTHLRGLQGQVGLIAWLKCILWQSVALFLKQELITTSLPIPMAGSSTLFAYPQLYLKMLKTPTNSSQKFIALMQKLLASFDH